VENPAAGENLLAAALESFGALDGFIANAGISEGCSFHKQGLEDFRRMIEINLVGTVNSLHPAFCRFYEQQHGSIIVSTSAAGLYGEHGLPAYSASKAALLGLTLSLSKEGKSHGVRVNALAPYASTQMTEANLAPALRQRLQPERVAPAVAWLLSDECEVSGEILLAGGGRMSRAGVRESTAVLLPENPESGPTTIGQAWQKLKNCPLDEEYHGALEHFAGFIGRD
jgi:NAD(P)-dependent dehydrogenase (short-subunit alcohol dehydrogenase family)